MGRVSQTLSLLSLLWIVSILTILSNYQCYAFNPTNSFHRTSVNLEGKLLLARSSRCSGHHIQMLDKGSTRFDRAKSTFSRDIGLLSEKLLDTAEDAYLHFRRYSLPFYTNTTYSLEVARQKGRRPRVVVVGSGWASHAFLKIIETDIFDVVCISPRPFFIFTPMLASSATGVVEYRSIVEPIRASNPTIDFIEGSVIDICPQEKHVTVSASTNLNIDTDTDTDININIDANTDTHTDTNTHISTLSTRSFQVDYDLLVYAVGSKIADFGTEGVKEHCCFIKEIEDVKTIKKKILNAFELASLPTSQSEDTTYIQQLLTFAIVGAGPTGVEFAAELADFVNEEVARLYPRLLGMVKIVLLSSGPQVLAGFDAILQERALSTLVSRGVDVQLGMRVSRVTKDELFYAAKKKTMSTTTPTPTSTSSSSTTPTPTSTSTSTPTSTPTSKSIKYGVCVWAAGTEIRPITSKLASRLGPEHANEAKRHGRLSVDPWLRIKTLNDATSQSSLSTSSDPPHPPNHHSDHHYDHHKSIFAIGDCSYLVGGDQGLILPQTAQVAAQQGAYVARLFNRGYNLTVPDGPAIPQNSLLTNPWALLRVRLVQRAKPFAFLNLGLLAYVGNAEAVAQVQFGESTLLDAVGGPAFLLWRSVYLVKQVSTRTRVLVLFDFIKATIFGRDITTL